MSTLSKCPLSSLTKTSCIFAMSGKSPGLIWCSRCSCEYLTICFYFLLWIPDNLFNMASTQFIDLLIMFSGKPWENISDLHFVQCFYKLTMLPLKHKWILKLSLHLSRTKLTMHPDPWSVLSASSPFQTHLACPSSNWRWCRREPDMVRCEYLTWVKTITK